MDKKCIVICGPTASGKSYLGHYLAKTNNGEIVNCDSCQVYKGLSTLTASPSENDKSELPYHLYNFLTPDQGFSVIQYINLAANKIREIANHKKLPILIGGTGLYINALLYGYNQIPDILPPIRKHVRSLLDKIGLAELYSQLRIIDPLAYFKLKANDTQRILRAYEVRLQTGQSIFDFQKLKKELPLADFNFQILYLLPERKYLYRTCDERLEKIFNEEAIFEVKSLIENFPNLYTPAVKAIGVQEIMAYLRQEISFSRALTLTQTKTRQYAKRQITWFKNQIKEKQTLEYSNQSEFENIVNNICLG